MRKAILIALVVVAVVVVLPLVGTVAVNTIPALVDRGGCSEGEVRVFREFPHYGGRQLEPEYNGSAGCFVAFTTEDASEPVRAYYTEQLTTRGWTLDPPPPPVEGAEGESEAGGLNAARGRYGYGVLSESLKDGTSVVIYVIERDS